MATNADTLVTEVSDNYADAKALASDAQTKALDGLDQANADVEGLNLDWLITGRDVPTVAVGSISAPASPSDFSNDVKQAFDDRFGQLNDDIRPQIEEYLAAFFPDIDGAIKTDSDAWIINTIINGQSVPIAVETALYNRGRDREVQEALRAEQSVIEASASRGFTMPTGAVTASLLSVRENLARNMATLNREIVFKSFDVLDANVKFAIQQAVSLRTAFVGALANFIQTAMMQPNQALDYAKTILAAKSGLSDAAVNLYRSQIEEQKLRTSVGFGNDDAINKWTDTFVNGRSKLSGIEISQAEVKSRTALSAADTLARISAAAMATRNTMINVGANV